MHTAQWLVTANANYLYGGGAAIATLVIAFGGFESWQPIVRIVLLYITYVSVVRLIMHPSRPVHVAAKTS